MTPELRRIASRVVWCDTPEHVVCRLDDFLCRVMALGDFADANYVEAVYAPDRLRTALTSASPGLIDIRSWHYWHVWCKSARSVKAVCRRRPSARCPRLLRMFAR